MKTKDSFKKVGFILASTFGVLAIAVGSVGAFTGPGDPGGVGYGAIASDASNNIAIGNDTTMTQTKLGVTASSTASSSYAFRIEQPAGDPIFSVRNDGVVSIPGTISGNFTGTISASNVSSATFGANTGGGNYVFPAQLTTNGKITVTTAGGATGLDLATADSYAEMRVIRNSLNAADKDLYLQYAAGAESKIHLYSANSETMTLAGGAVGINQASPNINTGRLEVVNGAITGRITGSGPQGYGQFRTLTPSGGFTIGQVDGSFSIFTEQFSGTNETMTFSMGPIGGGAIQIQGPSLPYDVMAYKVGEAVLGVESESSGASNTTAGLKLTAYNTSFVPHTWSMQTTRNTDGGAADRIAFKYASNDRSTMSGTEVVSITNSGRLGVGTSSPAYPLSVNGVIHSASGGFRFPDGTVQTTADGGGGGGTVTAPNVSSGAFGANTGGGNYSFPSNVSIGTTNTSAKLTVLAAGGGSPPYSGIHLDAGGANNYTAVSVGRSSTNPDVWLGVAGGNGNYLQGASQGDVVLVTAGNDLHMGVQGAANTVLTLLNSSGYVGIGTMDPEYQFHVKGIGAQTAMIGDDSDDVLSVGGGLGKIEVGTVDPIYQIGGDKFATYMAGMIGVKEEVAGNFVIGCKDGRCEKTIDFDEEPRGSDLWLFGKTTDIDKHLPQASIMLTPSFDGRVSYRKGSGTVTIIATPFTPVSEVEVSYRFTAPRFDADQWTNRNDESSASGFVIEE